MDQHVVFGERLLAWEAGRLLYPLVENLPHLSSILSAHVVQVLLCMSYVSKQTNKRVSTNNWSQEKYLHETKILHMQQVEPEALVKVLMYPCQLPEGADVHIFPWFEPWNRIMNCPDRNV